MQRVHWLEKCLHALEKKNMVGEKVVDKQIDAFKLKKKKAVK